MDCRPRHSASPRAVLTLSSLLALAQPWALCLPRPIAQIIRLAWFALVFGALLFHAHLWAWLPKWLDSTKQEA